MDSAELAQALNRMNRVMETGFNTLADLLRETNGRIDQTNSRLDQTNSRLDETNSRLGRLEDRFDNFLTVAGGESRALRRDVDRLTARVEALERDAQ